jgi:hypothetical protein
MNVCPHCHNDTDAAPTERGLRWSALNVANAANGNNIVVTIPNINACNPLPIVPITLNGTHIIDVDNGCAGVVPSFSFTAF